MLRQQLRQMNIEKAKNNIIHNLRETQNHKKHEEPAKEDHVIPTEPYPITFRTHTPSPTDLDRHHETAGRSYSSMRRRRQSREFEDLRLHSETGKLHQLDEQADTDDGFRRRVQSMSQMQRPKPRQLHADHHSNASTPRGSPGLRRRVLSSKMSKKKNGGGSSGSSKEDVTSVGSLDDMHWIGEPEAIHSVRRPRKSVEEQEQLAEFHKLGIK